jgi:hypothetical protein
VPEATRPPQLAACLIVRDEAARLPDCLAGLRGVVDRVHVLDTGSVDATVRVATGLGARVRRGTWSDDFAAARTAALAGWRSEWVLSVDADNRVVADPAALRAALAGTDADVLLVDVDNEHDRLGYTHREGRLFRPGAVRWVGRVHERLVGVDRPARVAVLPREVLYLRHDGYADPAVRAGKALRNVRLGRIEVDELIALGTRADPAVLATALLDLGRSLVAAGRRQDAVDTFETLRELFPGTREWLEATDFLARLLLGAGMDEVCVILAAQLRAVGAAPMYCDWLQAQALAQLGDPETAWRLISGVTEVVDTGGRRYHPSTLAEVRTMVGRLRAAYRAGVPVSAPAPAAGRAPLAGSAPPAGSAPLPGSAPVAGTDPAAPADRAAAAAG